MSPTTRIAVPLAVAAAVFVAFHPALGADWVNYDDPVNFQNNPHYRGLGPAQLAWMFTDTAGHYIPLTWMSLGLDYLLWGMNPAGYHFTNVLLHAVNAALAYAFLLLLLPRCRKDPIPPAWLRGAAAAGALLYALHPLRVESVAWVTERRDLVAGLFFLSSLIAYLKAVPPEPERPAQRRWLALSALLFAASLLGKTIGMTLPLALLALDAYPLRRLTRASWKRALLEKTPFLALMVAGMAITAVTQKHAGSMYAEAHTLPRMLARPGHRLAFYLRKTVLPVDLSPLYPDHPHDRFFETRFVLSYLALAALAALLIRFRRSHPGALTAAAAFAALLGPVIGPLQAGPHFAADRYTYLAALPLSVLAAGALLERRTFATASVFAAAIALLGGLTIVQSGHWRSSEALWTHALSVDATSDITFNQRASGRFAAGNLDGALDDLNHALRLNPRSMSALVNRARVRLQKRDAPGARADVDEALKVDPRSTDALEARGALRRATGDLPGALEDFSRSLELNPKGVEAFVERAATYGAMGRLDAAWADCERALALNPGHPGALINRGVLRGEREDYEGAAADYGEALRLSPRSPEAWGGRALCRFAQGRWREAVHDFERVLEVAPPGWPYRADTVRRLAEARRRLGSP